MSEVMPETDPPKTLAATVSESTTFPVDSKSFMLTFDVAPTETSIGKLSVSFLPGDGEQGRRELYIDLADRSADFAPAETSDWR